MWQAFRSWSTEKQAIYCPIDFRKAFDSVSHEYAKTFLTYLCVPEDLVRLMMALFTAPICLSNWGHTLLHHTIVPSSGVWQGCPLSLVIFAMLISPLAHKLMFISTCVQVLLYAGNLLIIITGEQDQALYSFSAFLECNQGIFALQWIAR